MSNYDNILVKLDKFTKKFYSKMLIKGALLFVVLGVLFFFVVLGVEYFLWLNSTGRLLLLFVFFSVEGFLLFRYILTPLFYLFKLRNGISNKDASLLIGTHFPNVGDKLYNLLELTEDTDQSELLLASIEQRSQDMHLIPFTKAIDLKDNLKYTKYLAIPIILLSLIWLSGNIKSFFGSANRVVNYDMAYEPPAPFRFRLLSSNLDILESEPHTIEVITEGEVQPEAVYLDIKGKMTLLKKINNNYQYTFSPPLKNTDFSFVANGIRSKNYRLNALSAPSIQTFKLVLDYPNYTGRSSEELSSTGNATFPEGTKATWEIEGLNTENIQLRATDTIESFLRNESENTKFVLSKNIYNDYSYTLSTSNKNVTDYEKLAYLFTVIRDAYPTLKIRQELDSLNPNISYYEGEASDDYKLKSIKLVYYADDSASDKQVVLLSNPNANFDRFYYTFPSGLDLDPGRMYSFYFTATDNDGIHQGKTTKSQVFSKSLLNKDQLRNEDLESQQTLIKNMGKSLDGFKEQKESLKEINQEQKEKEQMNFNDQNQVKEFLQKQQQQENLMQKFSKQLKENLEKGDKDFSPVTKKERKAIPSACWQCVARDSIVCYVEDGRLVKIEGNPQAIRNRGKICSKGQAGVNQVYDPDRILYPMVRAGERGEGKWKRVSWDEALELLTNGGEIAGQRVKGLKALRDEGHPENFMFHYGRLKGSDSNIVKDFLTTYGTGTIGNHTSICEGGKWVAQELVWGKHYDVNDVEHANVILNFGCNFFEAHTSHIQLFQRAINAVVDK
ncbi:hypothetical protein LCGC14_1720110, partial [marine sediment metagenome]